MNLSKQSSFHLLSILPNLFIADSPVEYKHYISKDLLISEYKNRLNMDIADNLSITESIKVYECSKSGYRFFHPFSNAGDSKFYETLQDFDWYYVPWKWEHGNCRELIKEGYRVLEVGCG